MRWPFRRSEPVRLSAVKRLRLGPDDVLVVLSEVQLPQATAEQIRAELADFAHTVIVLGPGFDFAVIAREVRE